MRVRTVAKTAFLIFIGAIGGSAFGGLNRADAQSATTGCPADAAHTFYVAPDGSDSNTGSKDAPWKTLQHAFTQLDPGETLLVREGVYRADLTYERVGTADAPITIANYPGETPVLEPLTREPLRVRGAAAWTVFEGLTFQHAAPGSNYQNVYVLGSAHDVTFKRNTIRWARAGSGIFVDNTVQRIDLIGNRVYANNEPGVQRQGIYYEGQDGVIARNIVHGHTNGFGIQVKSGADRVVVAQNTTADNRYSGIVVMDTADEITVANNVSAFNGGYGVRGFGSAMTEPAGHVFGNLVFGNLAGGYGNQSAGILSFDDQPLSADPLFVDRPGGDYRVREDSPAIDAADDRYVFAPDPDGGPALSGGAPDMGAYEAGG